MERLGAARDLIPGYVEALNALDEAVRAAIPSLERLADVLGLVRSRRISSLSGQVGTYSYKVHGPGASSSATTALRSMSTSPAGAEVWRLRWYGRSLPEPVDVTDEDLLSPLRSLPRF
ncbi:DUF6896 domain-containing protein [Streptomyces sp. NPDC057411]|uniref:DUF6896 domain-containing protein n=1 Tax=unclassified Streptomyces TaxID=2593676 RepID=UPI00362B7F0B